MNNIKKLIVLLIPLIVFGQIHPEVYTEIVADILNQNDSEKYSYAANGIFDENHNFWLSWKTSDRMNQSYMERQISPTELYYQWFVQKFNSEGIPVFPPVEVTKSKVRIGGGGAFPIHHGVIGDVYSFPIREPVYHNIVRIDGKGELHEVSDLFCYMNPEMFIVGDSIMYLFSSWSDHTNCLKFNVQDQNPLLISEQTLPGENELEGYKYNWIGLSTSFCLENYILAIQLPGLVHRFPLTDSSRIAVYRIYLPEITRVDTSSFRIKDGLLKVIKGCKFETSAFIEGRGDTLLYFLPNNDGDIMYVCGLTRNGKPLKTTNTPEISVKSFALCPNDASLKIVFKGTTAGNNEKSGILIYGFDKKGNVYYYPWNKSDVYWR